jgi:hypothetical protein
MTRSAAAALAIQCREARAARPASAIESFIGQSIEVEPHVLCFFGTIMWVTARKPLIELIERTPKGAPLTIYVESGGGQAVAALDIAEAILARDTTVVTGPLCASACADFIFIPARHRVIGKDSIVAFHGGKSLIDLEQFRAGLADLEAKPDSDPAMVEGYRSVMATLDATRPRALAVFRTAAVKESLYGLVEGASAPLPAVRRSMAWCANAQWQWLVFSERAFKAYGVKLDLNLGPKRQADLDANSGPLKGACLVS